MTCVLNKLVCLRRHGVGRHLIERPEQRHAGVRPSGESPSPDSSFRGVALSVSDLIWLRRVAQVNGWNEATDRSPPPWDHSGPPCVHVLLLPWTLRLTMRRCAQGAVGSCRLRLVRAHSRQAVDENRRHAAGSGWQRSSYGLVVLEEL